MSVPFDTIGDCFLNPLFSFHYSFCITSPGWSLVWRVFTPHRTLLWEWDGGKVIFTGDKTQKEHFNATNIYGLIRLGICVPLIYRSLLVFLLLGSADNRNLTILHSQQIYKSCLLRGWWQNLVTSFCYLKYKIFYFEVNTHFIHNICH